MSRTGTIWWRIAVVAMLVAVVPSALTLSERQREVDTSAMLDVAVSIRTVSQVTTDQFGDSVWSRATGSGFLVDALTCEVWTNHHVVDGAAIIQVVPRGWRLSHGIPAVVLASTPRHDVAILRMESCEGIREATLGDSERVAVGRDTYAVGNPLGNNPDSISRGIISHTERYADGPTPYLQTDAAITQGNSGGALFNRHGEVIGMNSAIAATREGGSLGIGYATPINLVRHVAQSLKGEGLAWGDAGLTGYLSPLSIDEANVFGVPTGGRAVNITKDPEDGPAKGQLRARDVIFQVGEAPVEDVESVYREFARYRPGDTVPVRLMRNAQAITVPLKLVDGAEPQDPPAPEHYDGHLGMTLEMWSESETRSQGFDAPVITAIQSLGPAHRSLISSSQRAGARRGPFMTMFQLDVKTITGVVLKGRYHAVRNIEMLNNHAELAAQAGDPLLLEVELWRRSNPSSPVGELERQGSVFYKVNPTLTDALPPEAEDLLAAQSGT